MERKEINKIKIEIKDLQDEYEEVYGTENKSKNERLEKIMKRINELQRELPKQEWDK